MYQEVVTYDGLPASAGGADDRSHDAAAHVQKHLPFRMSTKHWRRWSATKDGQSYRASKIASPLVS